MASNALKTAFQALQDTDEGLLEYLGMTGMTYSTFAYICIHLYSCLKPQGLSTLLGWQWLLPKIALLGSYFFSASVLGFFSAFLFRGLKQEGRKGGRQEGRKEGRKKRREGRKEGRTEERNERK